MVVHKIDVLYNETWRVKERVESCNSLVLPIDPATSSDSQIQIKVSFSGIPKKWGSRPETRPWNSESLKK